MAKRTKPAPSLLEDVLRGWFELYAAHALVGAWVTPPFRATLKGKTIELRVTAHGEERTIQGDSSAMLILAARFWGATRSAEGYAIAPAALPAFSAYQGALNNIASWHEDVETDELFQLTVLALAEEIAAGDVLEGVLLLRRWVTLYAHEAEEIPAPLRDAYFAQVGPAKELQSRERLSPQIIGKIVAPYAENDDPLVQITVAMQLLKGTGHLSYSDHDRYEALVGPMVKHLLGTTKGAAREAMLAVAEHLAWHLWHDAAYAKAAGWFELALRENVATPHLLRGLWACQYFLEDPSASETWNRANAIAAADGEGRGVRATFHSVEGAPRFRKEALRRMADRLERMATGESTSPRGRGRVLKADKARALEHGAAWLARAEALRAEAKALGPT